jgi:hypothetical protein
VLDSIIHYVPVVIINGLAAILFMIGYVLLGVAIVIPELVYLVNPVGTRVLSTIDLIGESRDEPYL